MANFWEDLKKNITEWSIVASEKAEEFTHTSKLRIDVLQLERKLSSHYVKLGLYVFSKTKEKNVCKVSLAFLSQYYWPLTAPKRILKCDDGYWIKGHFEQKSLHKGH